ncbi:glycosyltransferase, partial [Streptococcus pyogenes]
LPVVAFKPSEFVITATEELLSDAEAVFVEEVNSESLSEAVKTLISDPNNMARLSNLSRKIAIEKFSWEVLAHKLECYQ